MRTIASRRGPSVKLRRLDQKAVHHLAAETLLKHLPLEGRGEQSGPEKVVNALLAASSGRSSIEQVSKKYEDIPSANTVRGVLNECLDLQSAEDASNHTLVEHLCGRYWRKALKAAVDLHGQAYYGTPESEQDLRAGEHKDGTTQFHTFATVYVIRNGRRVTVALHFVRKGESLTEVLEALKKRLDEAGLRVGLWLADKAFAQVEALSWFDRQDAAYVPLALTGRKDPPTGTRALAARKRSGFVPYQMTSRDHRNSIRFTVAVARHGQSTSRAGKVKEARTLLYAVVGKTARRRLRLGLFKPLDISHEYGRRFGIESSYRQLQQGRARTSSRSAMLRLLLVAIALLLRNLWVLCRWMLCARPGPGPRTKDSDFTLEQLLDWIEFHLKVTLRYQTMLELPAPSEARF